MDDKDKSTESFFNSFNFFLKIFFLIKNNLFTCVLHLIITFNIFRKFRNLNDLINFSYKGLDFGKIVYDHYIRNSGDPSPNKLNYKFLYLLNESLLIYSQIKKFLIKINLIIWLCLKDNSFPQT